MSTAAARPQPCRTPSTMGAHHHGNSAAQGVRNDRLCGSNKKEANQKQSEK